MAESKTDKDAGTKLIASSPYARSDFHLIEIVEAGIVLTGTEIKSLRAQAPTIKDAFVEIHGRAGNKVLEAWLVNAHIPIYSHGSYNNHEPKRKRKLLLHRHQIEKVFGAISRDGLTVIPTRMYFKKGRAKIEVALARGKKKIDKRQDVKQRSAERSIAQAMKKKQRG